MAPLATVTHRRTAKRRAHLTNGAPDAFLGVMITATEQLVRQVEGKLVTGLSVAFFIRDREGYVAVHQRVNDGTWDFGAGKVELGESFDDAVLREMREEYGVAGEDAEYAECLGHRFVRWDDNHWLSTLYVIGVADRAMVTLKEPHKAKNLTWRRLDDLPSPMHPAATHRLTAYNLIATGLGT